MRDRERRAFRCGDLAAGGEEGLQDGGAVSSEKAGNDFDLMIESCVCEDFETGTDGATLWVVGAIDEARDASLDHGPGTHTARFQGDVESRASHAVIAEEASGFADYDDFGVRGGIAVANRAVAGAGENFAVLDEHGADGYFAGRGCGAGFLKGHLHECDVRFHLRREDNMRGEVTKQRQKETGKKGPQEEFGLPSKHSLMKSIFRLLDNWGAGKQTTAMRVRLLRALQIDFPGRCARFCYVQHCEREIC